MKRGVLVWYGSTFRDTRMTSRDVAWRNIRNFRHSPPGRAGKGSSGKGDFRAEIFDAALEQAEQLFKAAESVGPQSRPLLLFYGLSQAGRAISAAASKVEDGNAKLSGHGIKVRGLCNANSAPLADLMVVPQKGAFRRIADIVESSDFAGETRLGDLWGMLPGMERFPLEGSTATQPLTLNESAIFSRRVGVEVEVRPLPSDLRYVPDAAVAAGGDELARQAERDRVVAYLDGYPSLHGFEFVNSTGPAGLHLTGDGLCSLSIRWPIGQRESKDEVLDRHSVMYLGERLALPKVGTGARPAHPITIWWAILFALSMLARYEPGAWAKYVNVRVSADAVPIEELLEAALNALPETIYQVIVTAA